MLILFRIVQYMWRYFSTHLICFLFVCPFEWPAEDFLWFTLLFCSFRILEALRGFLVASGRLPWSLGRFLEASWTLAVAFWWPFEASLWLLGGFPVLLEAAWRPREVENREFS